MVYSSTDAAGVCISAGSACKSHEQKPSRVLISMGVSPEDVRNSIRISFSRENSIDEVVGAADEIVRCAATLASFRQK